MTPEAFNDFPADAKTWTYLANRFLTTEEQLWIQDQLNNFTEQWQAHGKPVKSASAILHDAMIVIKADETFQSATGCSIDSQTRFIQSLGEGLQVDFLNRWNVLVNTESGVEIRDFREVKEGEELVVKI